MMLIVDVAVRPAPSLAVTVTLYVPSAVGQPEIVPFDELMVTPAGRPLADHVTVPLLPETENVMLTCEFTVTDTVVREGVIENVVTGVGVVPVTVMRIAAVAVWPTLSVAVTVTLNVPAAVGAPEIVPFDELMVTPAGRPLADHVTVPLLPATENVILLIEEPAVTDTVVRDGVIVNGVGSSDTTSTLSVACLAPVASAAVMSTVYVPSVTPVTV